MNISKSESWQCREGFSSVRYHRGKVKRLGSSAYFKPNGEHTGFTDTLGGEKRSGIRERSHAICELEVLQTKPNPLIYTWASYSAGCSHVFNLLASPYRIVSVIHEQSQSKDF